MRSYGLKTYLLNENPPYDGHFSCPVSEESVPVLRGGHFGTADQLGEKHRYAKIGKRNSLPIIAKRFSPIGNIVMRSQKQLQILHRYANSSLNGAPVMRGTTVLT